MMLAIRWLGVRIGMGVGIFSVWVMLAGHGIQKFFEGIRP